MNRWPTFRLKYLVRINARTLPEATPAEYEFRYLDISAVGTGRLVAPPEILRFDEAPTRARRLVQQGDTIVSTVRTYLRAIWPVEGDASNLVVSTGFAVLSPGPKLDPGYFGWWAQSDPFIDEVVSRSVGVAYPAINALEIGDIEMPVPPLDAQRLLARYLNEETQQIDNLVVMLGGSTSSGPSSMSGLLLERRQALINTVVTGQLEMPGVAA